MCGRYFIEFDDTEDIAEIRLALQDAQRKLNMQGQDGTPKTSGEILPTDIVPIIGSAGLQAMQWGFPRYGDKGVVINARAETAAQKHMFSHAMAHRRCIVPASGFYEWLHRDKKDRQKHRFTLPGSNTLYMAAVYNLFPEEALPRFCILTTAANQSMAPYHDRMPVLVSQTEINAWLTDGDAAASIARRVPPLLSARKEDPQQPEQISFI